MAWVGAVRKSGCVKLCRVVHCCWPVSACEGSRAWNSTVCKSLLALMQQQKKQVVYVPQALAARRLGLAPRYFS